MSNTTSENWREHVADLLRHGHKIEAIKVYREATGAGLAEAKTFVEELQRTLRTGTLPGETSTDLEAELLAHLRAGGKIEAIKRYREATRSSLKEAKDAVEGLARDHNIAAPRGSGCLGMILAAIAFIAMVFR